VPGSRLEAAVSGLVARARMYERMAHDQRPWTAWVRGATCSVFLTMERHECDDRIVFTTYLNTPVGGASAVEIWSGGDMLASVPLSPLLDAPFRVVFALAIEDTELAA
jgi:hypothetical protein